MSIKKPILLVFVTAVVVFAAITILAFHRMHFSMEGAYLEKIRSSIEVQWKDMLAEKGGHMETILGILQQQETLTQAFTTKNRDRLLQLALPMFQQFSHSSGLSRMSFFLPDRRVLLRVDQPQVYGGLVANSTLLRSEREKISFRGFEPDSTGEFVFQVVGPWRDGNGKIIGFVELGMAIHPMVMAIKKTWNVELLTYTQKNFVNRKLWEEETKKLKVESRWNQFTDVVVSGSTLSSYPKWLNTVFLNDDSIISPQERLSQWYWLGHHDHFHRIDLRDSSDLPIGWLGIVINDEVYDVIHRQHFFVILLTFIGLSAFMMVLFFRRLENIEKSIARSIESLSESEARYSTILDTAMDAFISIDGNGIILEFNKSAEAMFGFSRNEVVGSKITETIIPEEMRDAHRRGLKRYLSTGLTHILNHRIELKAVHRDGHYLDIEVAITVVPMEKFTFFTAFLRDISQKKKNDERLRLQAVALEAAANPIVITDLHGIIEWINPAFTQLTGYHANEALGQKPSLLKSGEHDRLFYEDLWKTILSGQVWHHEVINKKKDGTRYIQETVITPVRDTSDHIRHFIAIQQDVTDKKRVENERNRFWLAVEQSPVTTVITDPDGIIEYVNPQFCRVTGYDQDEVIGRNPRFLKTDEMPTSVFLDLWQTISAGTTWRGELLNQKKSGERFWESTLIAPIFNDDGKIQHYLAIKEDITEKKAYETALQEARQKADAANRAKSEFLATMSHEIRTPMNGVLGMIELLLDSPLNEQQRKYALTVYRSGESLLTLLNDILDLSKIEASKIKLESAPLDLKELLNEVSGIFHPLAHSKALALTLVLSPPEMITSFLGDSVRLRQIMVNLTGNAVKFTETGAVTIQVTCLADSATHVNLRFEIRDTGIGIDEDAQKNLFHPFVQADSTTTRRYGGSGLGLSIVRKLVELMGGHLGLESTCDQGSTFWFEITLEKNLLQQPPPEGIKFVEPVKQITLSLAKKFPGARVLVAEDFEVNRDVILEMLNKLGCDVTWVENGFKAVEKSTLGRFDLIFMDLHMPEMDGFEATTHIRLLEMADKNRYRTPIIAVTADAMSGDREKCLAAGLDDYIAKPYRSKDLSRMLETWLSVGGWEGQSDQPTVTVSVDGVAQSPVTSSPSQSELPTITQPLAIIDMGELSNLQHDVGDELEFILSTFLRVLPDRLLDILTAADPAILAEKAHRLKGGAKTLGAALLANLCQKLEIQAKSGQIDTIKPLMDELREVATRTEASLRDLLNHFIKHGNFFGP